MATVMLPRAEYIDSLPKKFSASGAIFLNENDEILLLKVSYKKHWEIPGGIVEKDESPQRACSREIEEETGMVVKDMDFLGVAYKFVPKNNEESYQFYYFGGILETQQIQNISLQLSEATEYKFVSVKELEPYIQNSFQYRVKLAFEAIKNKKPFYVEVGE